MSGIKDVQVATVSFKPKYVFFVDQFPLTGKVKIHKYKLKELSLKLCEEQASRSYKTVASLPYC